MDSDIKKSPALTVLMPVYNAERFLRASIDSILNQTFTDFEFLIIDDASTDKSIEIIQSYTDSRIRLISHQKNQKLIASLNEGIEKASCELIARMDADDISASNRLELQYRFMTKNPTCVAVGSAMNIIDENGIVIGAQAVLTDKFTLHRALAVTNIFPHGSVMYRRSAVKHCGSYSSAAYLVEDYDLWTRLKNEGELANINHPLYMWRRNPAGESLSKSTRQRQQLQKVRDQVWQTYDTEGPSDQKTWSKIRKLSLTRYDKSQWHLFAELHIQFARAYWRHRQYWTAWQHLSAAIRMSPANPIFFSYILMFIMPQSWFVRLEEFGFQIRQKRRGW